MTRRSQSSGLSSPRLNSAGLGINFEQAVDGVGPRSVVFAHPLGGPPGRRAQQQPHAFGGEDAQDRIDDGGLADTRSAGDNQDLGKQGEPHRRLLAVGELQSGALLDPGQRLVRVDPRPRQGPVGQGEQALRDGALGPVQAGEEDAIGFADPVRYCRFVLQLEVKRRADQLRRDLKQALRQGNQLGDRQAAMALVHRLRESIGNPRPHPRHGGLLNAELHRNGVGGLRPDAADVARQPVRVLSHDLDGVGAVGLEKMRTARAVPTPWLCRNTMISRTAFCSAQAARMPAARTRPMPSTSRSRGGRRLDDVEHLVAERADQLLGVDRADAADHAGGEIFLHAVGRGRRRGAQKPRLELLAVGAVVDPFARRGNHRRLAMAAACPTTVTTSRWPLALARKTQKPFSAL